MGKDFLLWNSDGGVLRFRPSEGTQRRCAYIEILDDTAIEPEEQFTVRLSSTNPQVIKGSESTISIVDDDRNSSPRISVQG